MSDPRPEARITGLDDLLALIPFLLGFAPDDSLVIAALDERAARLITAVRVDLALGEQPPAAVQDTLAQVAGTLAAHGCTAVVVAGYGTLDRILRLLDVLPGTLADTGITLHDTVQVGDRRYRHLDTTTTGGRRPWVPFDPAVNAAATAAIVAGLAVLPDRAALAATLAPVTGAAQLRMAAATVTAVARIRQYAAGQHRGDGFDPAGLEIIGHTLLKATRQRLERLKAAYSAGRSAADEDAALLSALLGWPAAWTIAARQSTGAPWQIEMWSDLVRRAQPPFVTPVANLLALTAVQAGHGALASMAVDRALQADPGNRVAGVLRDAIAVGIAPSTMARLLHD
ncbi:DUF4192 domain-containing protein [Actinoplanes sp. CA-030573]|uniref:DUF4192 domain-containing protein n=1 Tax=Actinoplanes sp. CA-030573 TaxID=3239898 RepID=UPI003D9236F0